MSAMDMDAFGATQAVAVDVYTAAYRVSGRVETRFGRVADILNQLTGGHLTLAQATVSEHGDPTGTLAAPSAVVSVDEILVLVAPGLTSERHAEMRIPKRPVLAQLAIPPFRVTGTIHVPIGTRPVDGLLHVPERFMPMTAATLTSSRYPELERRAAVLALRRDRAHVLLVADDETPDELLADVLDERTAESWLRPEDEVPG
jgi:hypothetical protein